MSIINQMLRDLDARHAAAAERVGLPAGLRPLPPKQRLFAKAWLLGVVGLIVGVALTWFAVSRQEAPPVANPVAVAPSPPAPAPSEAAPPAPAPLPARPADVPSGSSPEVASAPATAVIAHPPKKTVLPPRPAVPIAEAVSAKATGEVVAAVKAVPGDQAATTHAIPTEPVRLDKRVKDVTPHDRAEVEYRKGLQAARNGDGAAAGLALRQALEIEPRHAKAVPGDQAATTHAIPTEPVRLDKRVKDVTPHDRAEVEYRKGLQAARNGDAAAAGLALRQALEIEPRHAKARQALLSVLAGSGQWDEVGRVAEAGLMLDPTRTGWAVVLARLQHERGDTAAALATLERHAEHAPTDADYQGLFAYLAYKQQRFDEAVERYRAALALRPTEGRWWYGFGLALENRGKADEAKEAYVRAKEIGGLPANLMAAIEQKLR